MDNQLKELHEQLKDITYDFADQCKKNNVDYCLAWGSCLGAVRHGDVIPWDDDVDVYILFKDYCKIKEAFKNREDSPYFFQDIDTDRFHFVSNAKIRKDGTTSMINKYKDIDTHWGICIDVFALFEYDKPTPDKRTLIKIRLLDIIAHLPFYSIEKETLKQRVISVVYKLMGEKLRQKLFFKLLNSLERKGDYYMDLEDIHNQRLVLKKDVFFPAAEKNFGSEELYVPKEYDSYLARVYGDDYMEIPEEGSDKRYVHADVITDCHRSYKEYK